MMEQIASRITLHSGDCLDILPTLVENSIDSCVTDPPYGLSFMGRGWDHGVPGIEFWREVYRTLKPGAHLVAFGGTRTYHRMACAIEDAGFEIRDSLMWVYGQGFPKSHDVSKGIDKAAGELEARGKGFNVAGQNVGLNQNRELRSDHPNYQPYIPATDAAREWQGWGTALKPAFEPIVLARKPLSESTVAANVLRWRTGALNIDGCRIATGDVSNRVGGRRPSTHEGYQRPGATMYQDKSDWRMSVRGRWPANVCHDGSDEVVEAFPASKAGGLTGIDRAPIGYSGGSRGRGIVTKAFDDCGSAARFFYSAKASKADRAGSKHPTIKPVSLMQWLCRLITPPGGTILDPFAGSGTTGAAARLEGFRAVLIEREAEYQQDIRNRFAGLPEAAE